MTTEIENKKYAEALLLECYGLLGCLDLFPDQETEAMMLRKKVKDYLRDDTELMDGKTDWMKLL